VVLCDPVVQSWYIVGATIGFFARRSDHYGGGV
jgi:hypothetical protein